MILQGSYTTDPILRFDDPVSHTFPRIGFLEFEFPNDPRLDKYLPEDLKGETGIELNVFWDTYECSYDQETGRSSFKAKGVRINNTYCEQGDIDLFRQAKLTLVQLLYVPEDCLPDASLKVTMNYLEFDGGNAVYEMEEFQGYGTFITTVRR